MMIIDFEKWYLFSSGQPVHDDDYRFWEMIFSSGQPVHDDDYRFWEMIFSSGQPVHDDDYRFFCSDDYKLRPTHLFE
jgi:hypothetical protein